MNRDEQIREELHLGAGSEPPEKKVRARESFEDRNAAAIRAALAARVDGEILDPGLRSRAAQRAIEQSDVLDREELARMFLDLNRKGAGFDDDLSGTLCARDIGRDLEQRCR